jgi:ketosteroid isomerase-like protein
VTEENVALVRDIYAAPDFFALNDRTSRDVEFDFSDLYPERPVIRGFEELRRFREESWRDPVSFEPERFIDLDAERVLVLVRVSAVGKVSGASVGGRSAHELTIRDGLVVRVKVYPDADEALRAAGLES